MINYFGTRGLSVISTKLIKFNTNKINACSSRLSRWKNLEDIEPKCLIISNKNKKTMTRVVLVYKFLRKY
jgi:phage-related protein